MSDEKLRVAFVTPGGIASRGGMGRMAFYLTEELRSRHPSIEVRVYDSYGPGRAILMPFYFLRCFVTLLAAGIVRPPDVLHLNLAAHGSTVRKLLLMWTAHVLRIPTLLHIHASKFIPFCDSLKPAARRLLIRSLSRASQIVVIGDYWRRYLVETLGVPGDIVTVIHNAAPLPAEPAARTNPRCRIVAMGQLGARKGTPELIDALGSASMRDLDWEAVIAGNGDVEGSRQRAHALGLDGRVQIPGWVDAATVAALLAGADIFTLPSHNEGLPVAILEAMAAALPVVTTPVGAIAELVIDNETGYLLPPGSTAELTAALARLVRDAPLRTRLGRNGRRRVEQHFRIEATAERFATIYRTLASANEAGAPRPNE